MEKMQRLDFYELTMMRLQQQCFQRFRAKAAELAARLNALSPLSTLSRGFSITTLQRNQKILRQRSECKSE